MGWDSGRAGRRTRELHEQALPTNRPAATADGSITPAAANAAATRVHGRWVLVVPKGTVGLEVEHQRFLDTLRRVLSREVV